MNQELKDKLFSFAGEYCQKKIQEIETALMSLRQSIQEDSKSSMGDKYETSREMAQQEINRLLTQQQQVLGDIATLSKVPRMVKTELSVDTAGLGSMVQVGEFLFLIAISLGLQKVEGQTYVMVSAGSPVGQELLGKKAGEKILFQGKQREILSIN